MQFTDKIKKLLHSVPRGFRISEDEEYPQTATRIKHCIEAKKGKYSLSLLNIRRVLTGKMPLVINALEKVSK